MSEDKEMLISNNHINFKPIKMASEILNTKRRLENKDLFIKAKEEVGEIEQAKTHKERTKECGDLGFCWLEICDRLGVNPQEALNSFYTKVISRTGHAHRNGMSFEEGWEAAKKLEK